MTKFFKNSKTLFWGHFAQIWEKINFPGKKGLCQFLNIRINYHRAKNQKKLRVIPAENAGLTMDKQKDRQTDGHW